MDKPKCRFCGAKHYSYEPHDRQSVSATAPSRAAPNHKAKAVDQRRDSAAVPSVRVQAGPVVPMEPTKAAKFDKTAYQRDYMRKRRAKLKV